MDMFGPRVGFIKFKAAAQLNVGGEEGVRERIISCVFVVMETGDMPVFRGTGRGREGVERHSVMRHTVR